VDAVIQALAVANAPCSYGAFEDTVGIYDGLPEPEQVLDHIASSGYDGTDLGPFGWLGKGEALAAALSSRGLDLAGGYLELPFSEPGRMDGALAELDRLLGLFEVVAPTQRVPPRPTLADHGSSLRRSNPGRAQEDPALRLDDDGWERLSRGVTRALVRCRERGFEPTFHHHANSHVEAPREIERLLEITDIDLCLDTGHLLVGGGDPITAVRDWRDRINHIHVKDCRTDVVRGIVDERAPAIEIWRRKAFCRLGGGDLDLDGFLSEVRRMGYEGWLVVEQDGILDERWPLEQAMRDQASNRTYLRERGL